MHTKLKKYRHLVFVLLLGSYLFSVFQYYSIKVVCTISHLAELNDIDHQTKKRTSHGHKLIKKIKLEEKDHSEEPQLLVELQERIEIIDVIVLDENTSPKEKLLNNFSYTNLQELFISKSTVPPPQLKG